ncbi:MAG TPA: thiolase family protein [Thermoanaerobaculia bacterium]|nr:thiolase family protein [Thermoanaerobaculia bacterium]
MKNVLVLSATRTPIGTFLGSLAPLTASEIGARALKSCLERTEIPGYRVDQVLLGNVLQAGQGQAPARQALIAAGLPRSTGAVTIHKVCGSGMRAVMDGANAIRAGEHEIVLAGGMESMSNAPYLLPKGRTGMRMGHGQLVDGMIHDGLWDPYKNVHMGNCAEMCAAKYAFTREAQDAFSMESYQRARRANDSGDFRAEMVPVSIEGKKGTVVVDRDEEPFATPLEKLEKMGSLKPAFQKDGTVTAANSSKIDDGAAALLLATEAVAQETGAKPLGRIVSFASHAHEPEWFTTAPSFAAKKALEKAGIPLSQIDLFEVNEAFAVVTMAFVKDLEVDPNRVNVNGGAVAMGHPIGASGARILVTLLHALRARKKKYGLAAICIGGGEATAMVVEAL